jgi:hypothetical protein
LNRWFSTFDEVQLTESSVGTATSENCVRATPELVALEKLGTQFPVEQTELSAAVPGSGVKTARYAFSKLEIVDSITFVDEAETDPP